MAQKKKKQESHAGVGFAVAAVVAAAGAAFLFGTDKGKKTQKKIKGWTLKAKGEILEKLESAKDISEDTYHDIVDKVLAKYTNVKKVEGKEIENLLKEMKGHWRAIKKEVSGAKKATKKTAKKSTARARKVVKKTAKKTVATAKKTVKKVTKATKKPATKRKTAAKKK